MRIKLLPPSWSKHLWMILLISSPLAYWAGVQLYSKYNPDLAVGFKIDRAGAIALTKDFAASKGIAADNWLGVVKSEAMNPRHFYYRYKGEQAAASIRELAPIAIVNVTLISPARDQNIEVALSPSGRILSYLRHFADANSTQEISEQDSRRMAEDLMRSRPEFAYLKATDGVNFSENRATGTAIRSYAWKWSSPQTSEMESMTTIWVRGNEVIGEQLEHKLNEAFARQIFGNSNIPVLSSVIIYILLAGIIVIFGILRFAERIRQKEVSYTRLLIITAAIAITFGGFILQTDVATYDYAVNLRYDDIVTLSRVFGFLTWGVIGLLFGFAYGSGEGDLREIYPGKLTSLDALLTGRIFSRNVAQAIITGAALSGWLFLLIQISVTPFQHIPTYGWRMTNFEPFFSHYPWLVALTNWASFGVISVLFTLLLPLPLLQRRLKKRWVILLLLFLIACDASSVIQIQSLRPWSVALLPILLFAAAMLYSFFRFDLLTAILTLSSYELLCFALIFAAQSAPELNRSATIISSVIVAVLAVSIYFYFNGRWYRESEVRPLYASHQAERLSMQAEVSAAREAQIRLMPDHLPEMPHLAVGAACQPAHDVGGDFYDLFELEQGKLGIFMADGGGRGLASALTIAFAKGFLMPRITSDYVGDNSPTEIVRGLQTQLVQTMAEDEMIGFVFAVIDPGDNTLRYAGIGNFPNLYVNPHLPEPNQNSEKNVIKFSLNEDKKFSVVEGRYYLKAGDTVTIHSDGVSKLLADNLTWQSFWNRVGSQAGDSSYRLRDSLLDALQDIQKSKTGIEDDLTAVVVHLTDDGRRL